MNKYITEYTPAFAPNHNATNFRQGYSSVCMICHKALTKDISYIYMYKKIPNFKHHTLTLFHQKYCGYFCSEECVNMYIFREM